MAGFSKHDVPLPAYRIDLQYSGSPYHGWQSQPSGAGVQDHVEQALARVLKHPVRVLAASRTDTGVHAEHQVAVFRTAASFDRVLWLKSLYGLLPPSIGILALDPVAASFHPAYSAVAKVYCYRFWLGATRSPLVAPYVWHILGDLSLPTMKAEAQAFLGTHDFASFCAADSSAKTTTRTVLELAIHQRGPFVELWLLGPGFLKQMVRIMVGTLVDVALGRKPSGTVPALLLAADRTQASRTAPAQGLSLVTIFYDDVKPLAAVRAESKEGFTFRIPLFS